jgi:hypothetical protein
MSLSRRTYSPFALLAYIAIIKTRKGNSEVENDKITSLGAHPLIEQHAGRNGPVV